MTNTAEKVKYFHGLYQQGQFGEITARFCDGSVDVSESLTLKKIVAASFLHLGEVEHAVEILEKLADGGVPDPEVFNSLGIAHRRQARFADARFCLERAIELRPDYVEAFNNLGTVFWGTGDVEAALQSYDKALALRPQYLDALFNKARVLIQLKRYEGAVEALEAGLQVDENSERFLDGIGSLMLEQRKYSEAVNFFRRALVVNPQNISILNNLGNAYLKLGQTIKAIAQYDNAISIDNRSALSFFNLGIAQRQEKLYEEATTSLRTAASLGEDNPRIMLELANTLRDGSEFVGARRLYESLLQNASEESQELRLNYGVLLSRLNLIDEAAAQYRAGLKHDEANPQLNNNLGNILRTQGKPAEAVACYRRSLQSKPVDADIHYNLAIALQDLKQYVEAEAEYRLAIDIRSNHSLAYLNLGGVLKILGRPHEAMDCYLSSHAADKSNPDAQYNLGVLFMELGRFDEATLAFQAALSIDQYHIGSLRNLTGISGYRNDPNVSLRLELLWRDEALKPRLRAEVGFARYNVLDKEGKYSDAFEYLLKANEIRKRDSKFSIEGEIDAVQRIKKLGEEVYLSANYESQQQSSTPIFIVGMPRSGTTLLEQIVSSHSQVIGAGELPFLKEAVLKHKASDADPCVITRLVASHYYDSVDPNVLVCPYFTDKMPQNFLFAPYIAAAFPHAKIIHIYRDARATIWSNFERYFPEGLDYSYSLEDLVKYYNLYSALMLGYAQLMNDKMYHLSYDKLTENQQQETENLFDYLKLPLEPQTFRPHENIRIVATASNEQVRTPVYKGSSQRWRRYENLIGDRFDTLADFEAGLTL